MAAGRLPPFVPSRPRPIIIDGQVVTIPARSLPTVENAPPVAGSQTRARAAAPVVHERRNLPHPFRAPTPKPGLVNA